MAGLCRLLDMAGDTPRRALLRGDRLFDRDARVGDGGHRRLQRAVAADDVAEQAVHVRHPRRNVLGRRAGLLRQHLHLARHHREATPCLSHARRLDRGIEGEQVGLAGDRLDQAQHVVDRGRFLHQPRHAIARGDHRHARIVAQGRGAGRLPADAVQRRRQGPAEFRDVGQRGDHLPGRTRHRRRIPARGPRARDDQPGHRGDPLRRLGEFRCQMRDIGGEGLARRVDPRRPRLAIGHHLRPTLDGQPLECGRIDHGIEDAIAVSTSPSPPASR